MPKQLQISPKILELAWASHEREDRHEIPVRTNFFLVQLAQLGARRCNQVQLLHFVAPRLQLLVQQAKVAGLVDS